MPDRWAQPGRRKPQQSDRGNRGDDPNEAMGEQHEGGGEYNYRGHNGCGLDKPMVTSWNHSR